jgi:hypothetical protein
VHRGRRRCIDSINTQNIEEMEAVVERNYTWEIACCGQEMKYTEEA